MVRKIFQTFLDEGSRAKTVEKLHALGIRPKRTSKKQKAKGPTDWTVQTLGSLLENTAYIGCREVNKLYKDEDPSHLKPWQKYQIVKAAWPAIISEKVFHDAQHLLEEAADKERTRLGKREKRVFLLTGILTCGELGLPLVGQAGHGRNGTAHRYYHYVRKPKDLKITRPRLSADELEEKVFEEFKIALRTQGYFADLEKTLRAQAEANGKGSAAEFQRVQRDLKDVTERISMIWANQGRMQLSEDALRLASEELNRLAKQKQDLEKYLGQLDPKATDPQVFHEQALFVENQIRWCLQGWSKATPSVRKRLLRRTIKEIVVTQTELCITFWTSAEERDHSPLAGDPNASEGSENVVAFRRRSPQASDQNLWVNGSGKVRNGRDPSATCNLSQVHDFIEISIHLISRENTDFKAIYEQGHSINEIADRLGFPYSTVRDQLVRMGVTLRTNKSVSFLENQRQTFKNSAPPPYGYCYLEGRLQKDPREYPTLQMIEKQRQLGRTPTEIARFLSGKGFRTRHGKSWSQSHVFNIVQKLKTKKLSLQLKGENT